MKTFWHKLYARQSLFYKIGLCLVVVFLIVHFFPKNSKFQYEFQEGKLWLYETLYAPFEFSLKKSADEITREKQEIKDASVIYYSKDTSIYHSVSKNYNKRINSYFKDVSPELKQKLIDGGHTFLKKIYDEGVLLSKENINDNHISLIEGAQIEEISLDELVYISRLKDELKKYFNSQPFDNYVDVYYSALFDIVVPNIVENENFTQKILENNLNEVIYSKGIVNKNQLIIARGEIIQGEKLAMLESLQAEYESDLWNTRTNKMVYWGYVFLVGVIVLTIVIYLYRFRRELYENNSVVTFIFVNILLMVFFMNLVVKIDPDYIYAIPVCILPLTLKAFFDFRLGLFIYFMMLLIIGFMIPNSFQFIFVSMIACGSIMFNINDIHHRVSLFITSGYITLVYIITYFLYEMLSKESFYNFDFQMIGVFILNGFLILFVQPLTYIYEKLFGLVSNASLLELSDTNSKLLKILSEKAPGTFQHSLQVANLAEAAASEIEANTLLVRVGALYHDIGKLNNPMYFTENQRTLVNPHDELTPKESARVIINHVIDGIEKAREYNIPDRIIDFIRTHHGTSLVYYFYKKQLEINEPFEEADFHYPGPIPFSKETTILMMADSVEAASKSLKNPTHETIDKLVESIIKKQFDEKQFMNANISLKEIERIKKVFKEKLININRLRIEYPD